MNSTLTTRVVLGLLCLIGLSVTTITLTSPVAHPYTSSAIVSTGDDDDKRLPTPAGGITPKRKPVRRVMMGEIPPLKTLPLRSARLPWQASLVNDPIRFALTANKDSLAVGEEIELTIRAELLPISPSMLFFLEEQKAFSLKLLVPSGFIQTGGSYVDGVGGTLTQQGQSISYTWRGRKVEPTATFNNCFVLLRGPLMPDPTSLYTQKGIVCPQSIRSDNQSYTRARLATVSTTSTNSTPQSVPLGCENMGLNYFSMSVGASSGNRTGLVGPSDGYSYSDFSYEWLRNGNVVEGPLTLTSSSVPYTFSPPIPGGGVQVVTFRVKLNANPSQTCSATATIGNSATPTISAATLVVCPNTTTDVTIGCPANQVVVWANDVLSNPRTLGPGTYSVNCRDSEGFMSYPAPVTIQEISTPTATPTISRNTGSLFLSGGRQVVCPGQTVVLTASGCGEGQSYEWLKDGSFYAASAAISPTVSATYAVRCKVCNNSGSSNPLFVDFVVLTLPTITGETDVCEGSISLTATCNAGMRAGWEQTVAPSNVAFLLVENPATYTASCRQQYGIDGFCMVSATRTIIDCPPVSCNETATAGAVTSCLSNGTAGINLTHSGQRSGLNWFKKETNGSLELITGASQPALSVTEAGTYLAKVYFNSPVACTVTTNEVQITGNCPQSCQLTATATPNSISLGQTITLTASGATGITWASAQPNNGLNTATNPVTATPTAIGTYYYVASAAGCPSATATVTVSPATVTSCTIAAPTVSTDVDCAGNWVKLTVAGCTGQHFARIWFDGQEQSATTGTSPALFNYALPAPGSYTYTARCVRSGNCDSGFTPGTVAVNCSTPCSDPGTPTALSPRSASVGEMLTLTASGCNTSTLQMRFNNGTWQTGSSLSTGPLNLTGTFSYEARCVSGTCIGTAVSAQVSVTATTTVTDNCLGKPQDQAIAGSSNTLCSGGTISLTAQNCGDGGTVSWSNNLGNNSIVTAAPLQTTTYQFTCTYPSGCQRVSSGFTVQVSSCTIANPCAGLGMPDPLSPRSVTVGGTLTLQASGCGSQTLQMRFHNGAWTDGGSLLTGTLSVTGSFTYEARCVSGTCTSDPVNNLVTVTPLVSNCAGLPTDQRINGSSTTLCLGGPVSLTALSCGDNGTLNWSNNLGTNQIVQANPTQTTTYQFTCTYPSGCQRESQGYTVTVSSCTTAPPCTGVDTPATLVSRTATVGESLTLLASGCAGQTLQMRFNGGTWQSTGSLLTGSLPTTGVFPYEARCLSGTCLGTPVSANVSVSTAPLSPPLPPTINPQISTIGQNFMLNAAFTGSGITYSAGGLAPGLTINTLTGQITGTPTIVGVYSTTVTAVNAGGTASVVFLHTVQTGASSSASLTLLTPLFVCPTSPGGAGQFTYRSVTNPPGSTVIYSGVGLTSPTTNPGPHSVVLNTDASTLTIEGILQGASGPNLTLPWNWTLHCVPPAPPAITPQTVGICLGNSVSLTATGCSSGTVLWSNGATGTIITVSPTATTVLSAACLGNNGKQSQWADRALTVWPRPLAPAIYGQGTSPVPQPGAEPQSVTVCWDSAIRLVSSCPVGTQTDWYVGGSLASSGGVIDFTGVRSTSTVAARCVDQVNGCGASPFSTTVTIQPLEATQPTVTASQTVVCFGQPVTLSTVSCGTGQVIWNDNPTQLGTSFTTTTAGTYWMRCRGTNGCTGPASASVTISSVSFVLNAGSNSPAGEVLTGQPLSLSAQITGSSPANLTPLYSWSGPNWTGSGATPAPFAALASSSGLYSVTAMANGCQRTATTSVSITTQLTSPTSITLSPASLSYCLGSSVQLQTSCPTGEVSWTLLSAPSGGVGTSQTGSPLVMTITQAGVYRYGVSCRLNGISSVTLTANLTGVASPNPTLSANGVLSCTATAVTLMATGGTQYRFANAAETLLQSDSGASLSVGDSGLYSVTVTNGAGCSSVTTTTVASDTLTPTASIQGDTRLTCAQPSLTLTAAGGSGYSYRWNTNPVQTSQTLSVATSGVYPLTVIGSNGCSNTTSVTVTTDTALPSLTLVAGPASCTQSTASLTALISAVGGAYQYRLNGGTIQSSSAPLQTWANLPTGTQTVSITASNGCLASASTTLVSQTALPGLTLSPASGTLTCSISNLTLTAGSSQPGTVFRWSTGDNGSTLPVSSSGIYSVTATTQGGCWETASATITIDRSVPQPQIGGTSPVCPGTPTTLTVSGATTVRWDDGSTLLSRSVAPSTTTPYRLTATAPNGCTGLASFTLTVSPRPLFGFRASDPLGGISNGINAAGSPTLTVTITPGSSLTLSSLTLVPAASGVLIAYNSSGNITYTPGVQSFVLEAQSGVTDITPPETGTYFNRTFGIYGLVDPSQTGTVSQTFTPYTDTNSNNRYDAGVDCLGTPILLLYNFPSLLPATITASPGLTACRGTNITLTASSGTRYQWSTGETTASISVSVTGTYSVTVTQAGGPLVASRLVQLIELPIPTLSTSGLIGCQSSATLSAGGGTSYRWEGPSGLSSSQNPLVVTQAGAYSVIVSGAGGCTALASTTLTGSQDTPQVSVSVSNGLNCTTPQATLTASGSLATGTIQTYSWLREGTVVSGAQSSVLSTSLAGTYTVRVTGSNGCTATSNVLVTEDRTAPLLSASVSGPLTCTGTSVTLTATASTSTLIFGAGATRIGTSSQATVTSVGVYALTAVGTNGCFSSTSVLVSENRGAPAATLAGSGTINCSTPMISLTAGGGPGLFILSDGQQNYTGLFSVTVSGSYTVRVTGSNGCTAVATTTVFASTLIPQASISASRTLLCGGQTALLTGPTGLRSYTWTNGLGTVLGTTQSLTVSAGGIYRLGVEAQNGCLSAPVEVSIMAANTSVPQSVSLVRLTGVVPGTSVTVASGCSVGTPRWTGPTGLTALGATFSTTLTSSLRNLTVACLSPEGCLGNATSYSVALAQPDIPSIDFTQSPFVCAGTALTLSASGCPVGTLLWSTGATGRIIEIAPLTTTAYWVRCFVNEVTNDPSPSLVITVSNSLTVTLAGSLTYGVGQPLALTAQTAPVGSTTYTWSLAPAGFTTGGNPVTATAPTVPGNYTLTLLASRGGNCTGTLTRMISVTSADGIITGVLPQTSICPGSMLSVPFSVSGGSLSPFGLLLSNTGGSFASGTTSLSGTQVGNELRVLWPAGITPGTTYRVQVVSLANGSVLLTPSSTTLRVGSTPSLTLTPSSTTLSCAAASVSLSALTSGTPAYRWSDGSTGSVLSVSVAGTYTLTLTNADGCSVSATSTVVASPAGPLLSLSPSSATLNCSGTPIVLAVTGALGGSSYRWNTGATTATLSATAAGSYSVTVTSPGGCIGTASAVVSPSPALSVGISASHSIVCAGGAGATLTAVATPGATVTYRWSTAATTQSLTTLTAGTYSVTVTNGLGCQAVASQNVVNAPTTVVIAVPSGAVAGQALSVSALLTPQPALASYSWRGPDNLTALSTSNVLTFSAISATQGGTYTVVVTLPGGCTVAGTGTLTLSTPPSQAQQIIINPLVQTAMCAGVNLPVSFSTTGSFNAGNTFAVELAPAGGSFINPWVATIGSGSPLVLSIPPSLQNGNYMLRVVSSSPAGVSALYPSTITIGPLASPIILPTSPVLNCGTGSVLLSLTGVVAGSQYLWSTGATTATIPATATGVYSVTVTDPLGCKTQAQTSIGTSNIINVSIANNQSAVCTGGLVTLTANPIGTANVTYLWSTGATTPSISTSQPGTYSVQVRSSSGCTATASAVIASNASFGASISGPTTGCNGQAVTLSASAGQSYLWSTGATIPTIQAGSTGTYSVTITGVGGCTAQASMGVTIVPPVSLQITGPSQVEQGSPFSLGLIIWTSQNTNLWFTYTWQAPASYVLNPQLYVSSATQAHQGTYTVTANYGPCVNTASRFISVVFTPPGLQTGTLVTGTVCAGSVISVPFTATGNFGVGNQFVAELSDATGSFMNGVTAVAAASPVSLTLPTSVTAGSGYRVRIRSTNTPSLSALSSSTLTIVPLPVVSIVPSTNVLSCSVSAASLTATGGSSYRWSTGQTTTVITATAVGPYSVTATNTAGCSRTASMTLLGGGNLVATITGSQTLCPGQSTTLLASSGIPGQTLTYRWNTEQTTATISATAVGPYSVTVTDANGCSQQASVTLSEGSSVSISITGSLTLCPGLSSTLLASSGLSGQSLTYRWGAGQTTASLPISSTGVYSLTATNAQGCMASSSVTVGMSPSLTATIAGNTSLCTGGTVNLTALASSGQTLSYRWSTNGAGLPATTAIVSVSAVGPYSVTVLNAAGCSAVASTTLTSRAALTTTLTALPNQLVCPGVSVTLIASGGSTYLWSTPPSAGQAGAATSATVVVTPQSTTAYSVTITDAASCSAITSLTISIASTSVAVGDPATDPLAAQVLFSLKAPGSNLSQNNTFVDGSANSLPVTRTGTTTQGNFGPASGMTSAYFGGSGGLSIPHSTQTNTTGDFTWETWFYPTAQTTGDVGLMNKGWSGGVVGAVGPLLYLDASRTLRFYASSDGSNWNISNGTVIAPAQLNTWQHVAVSRQGSVFRLFYNGQQVNTFSSAANIFVSSSPLTVGQGNNGANNLNGFLAGTRASNNARYTTAFTPATSYDSDANTNLLLNYSNAGVLDVTNKNDLKTGGDARVSSTGQPLGERVVTFDGTGDYLRTAIKPDYDLSTSDWTVDGWVYQTSNGGDVSLFDTRAVGEGIGLYTSLGGSPRRMSYANNTTILATANAEIPLNVWTHVAWQRRNGVVTGYMNGKQVLSATDTRTLAPSTRLVVGSLNNAASQFFAGSVYDLRLTKSARYSCDFAVPPTIAVLPSQTICAGQNTTLTASGGTSYSWNTGATTPSIVVSPTATTSYIVIASVTLPNGTFTATTTTTIVVAPLPTVSANSNTPDNTVLFSLKAPGGNLSQNNTFVDGSANSLPVTRTGTTTQGSFGPASGINSAYFGGAGGLSIPHSTQTNTTGDFTWETWFYPTAQTTGDVGLINKGWSSGVVGAVGPLLYLDATRTLRFYASSDGSNWNISNGTVIAPAQLNTWQHVAVSRQGSVFRLFYNGQQVNTFSSAANIFVSSSPLTVGQGNNGANNLNGFLAGTRASNNARYTTAFTPVTSYTTDANTNLLLNYSNAGVLDVTNKNDIETGGDARISTSQQSLGQNVVALDGTGDYLRTAISPTYSLGTGDWTGNGDWTFDGWVYQTSNGGDVSLFDTRAVGEGIGLYTSLSTAPRRMSYASNTTILATANVELPLNVWTHVVWQRRGSVITGYMNGKQVLSATDTRTLAPSTRLVVGGLNNAASQFFTGSVYDLRLRKGAYYACDFVIPPTVAVLPSQTICAGQSTTLTASGGNSYSWNTGATTTPSIVVSPTATTSYSVVVSVTLPNGTFTASSGTTIYVNALPLIAANSNTPDNSVLFSLKAIGVDLSHNRTFIDSSPSNLPITRTGTTTQGSFGPTPGMTSAYFGGSGGLSIPHSTQTNTTGDFTWETWFYPTAQTTGDVGLMNKGWSSGVVGAVGPLLYLDASRTLRFYASSDGANWNISNGTVLAPAQLNTWQHVAVSRQGSTFRLFYNGQQVNTFSSAANIFVSSSPLTVGQGNNGANNLNGFLAGTRASNNARYTAAFTPTTSYTTDANTNLLLNYSNAGVLDVTNRNDIETGGDARISTSQQSLGQNVVAFDGTGDYLRTAISPTYSLGTGDWTGNGDWTFDGWIYQTSNGGDVSLLDTRAVGEGIGLYTSLAASPRRMSYYTNTALLATANAEIPLNQWTHVAWQRRGSVVTGYMNGKQVLSATDTRTLAPSTRLVVGSLNNAASQFFTGSVYDLRLRKGAYYTCDFVTPATLPALPSLTAAITGNLTICSGNATTLTASAGASYRWSTPPGAGQAGATTQTLSTSVGGVYSVTVTNSNGTFGLASVTVTQGPALTLTTSGNLTVTEGQSITLTALLAPSGGSGGLYAWTGPNNYSATSQSVTVGLATTAMSGTYTVLATTPGGCTITAVVTVTVVPSFPCTCQDCDLPSVTATTNPAVAASNGGSAGQNYVLESVYMDAAGSSVTQAITYFDGLGRTTEKVNVGTGGNGSDLISISQYDAFGRQPRQYMPVSQATNNGAFRGLTPADVTGFYSGLPGKSGNAYTVQTFEASPLNRVLTQTAPGSTIPVQLEYRTNTASEAIKLLTYNAATASVDVSTYPAGQLYVVQTTDEKNQTATEYKDREGRVVCKDQSGRKTLYGYDDLGQLRVVVPPLASPSLSGSFDPFGAGTDLLFAYDYDSRGRMTRKKVPGASVSTLTYDLRDRLISSTDANNKQVVSTYDDLDRVVSTSLAGGQVLTRTTYDAYPADAPQASLAFDPNQAYGQSQNTANLLGMVTRTETLVLDSSPAQYLLSVPYYDGLNRVVQTVSTNHKGGLDRSSAKLDFVGRALESRLTTSNPAGTGVTALTVLTRTAFEAGGRVKSICQQVGDNQTPANGLYWEPVARHAYNGLGELTQKTLGCGLQQLDYAYQMRGWLTNINNPLQLDNGPKAADKDFFGMSLSYDAVGNITNWQYAHANRAVAVGSPLAITVGQPFSYGFSYDNLNRLTGGTLSQQGQPRFTLDNLTYDDNGNIQTLHRMQGSQTDRLTYGYRPNSNQLDKVVDSGTGDFFNNGATASNTDYAYDASGNMTQDLNKNIGAGGISYNHLNLPRTITRSGGSPISYTYTASGQKLAVSFPASGTVAAKQYDYVSGMVWQNNQLEFIGTAEGRVLPPGSVSTAQPQSNSLVANKFYRYEYQLRDHLSNLRAACRCGEKAGATNPSDAFAPVVVQEMHYDPWGLALTGLGSVTASEPVNRFTYNGKEIVPDLDLFEYGFRWYDPATARFIQADPLAEKFPLWTTYQYTGNMPINFVDLDGLEPARNPKSPGAAEKNGMGVVTTIAGYALIHHFTENDGVAPGPIHGKFVIGEQGYATDTERQDAELSNLYVNTGRSFAVDESEAGQYKNYEAFIVSKLMTHLVSGTGPENYVFPKNGIISSKFLKSDIIKSALAEYLEYEQPINKKVGFGFGELTEDLGRNRTLFNITGFVGSAKVSVRKANGGVDVNIFNISSLTSGTLGKELFGKTNWPRSYVRDGTNTPFGNISQTYSLFITNQELQKYKPSKESTPLPYQY